LSTSLPSSVPGEPDGTRKRHARCVFQAAGRCQPAGLLRRPRPAGRRPVSGTHRRKASRPSFSSARC